MSPYFSWVSLTGGEPFIRMDFVDIVKAFKRHSPLYILNIPTNGILTEKIEKDIYQILKLKVPSTIVTISLDGDRETHDYIRGIRGSFYRAVLTFKTLKQISKKNRRLKVLFAYTITPFNVGRFEEAYNGVKKEIEDISNLLINVPTEGFTDKEVAIMIVRSLKSEYDLIFSNNDKVYEGINAFNHIDEMLEYEGFSKAFFITYKKLFVVNFKWVFDVIKNSDFEPYVFFLPEKEEIKELDWVKKIWYEILNLRIRKDTAIVGIGGGSSLDLISFCTSTFRRGFPFVSVPTTFISQIDASIGGRNAIHYLNYKNVLGTIYYPRFILIDPVFILLSDEEKFLYSISDAIRYGLLFDSEIIDYLESEEVKIKRRYLPTIEDFIRRCALIKLNVYHTDPYGWSWARYFEFGNTIAYLIQEVLHLDYPRALTKSIYLILKFLEKNNILKEKNIIKRIEKLFELYTLDYHLNEIDIEKLNKKCQLDEIEITGIETYKSPLTLKIKREEIFKL